jgi:hypothetical protein
LVRLGRVVRVILQDVAERMREREKRAGETAGGKPQASPTGVSGERPLAGFERKDGLAEAKPAKCPGVRR